jgi:hypothetical protein
MAVGLAWAVSLTVASVRLSLVLDTSNSLTEMFPNLRAAGT